MVEAKAFRGQSLRLLLKRLPRLHQRLRLRLQKLLHLRRHVRAHVQRATRAYRKREILSLLQQRPRFLVWELA